MRLTTTRCSKQKYLGRGTLLLTTAVSRSKSHNHVGQCMTKYRQGDSVGSIYESCDVLPYPPNNSNLAVLDCHFFRSVNSYLQIGKSDDHYEFKEELESSFQSHL